MTPGFRLPSRYVIHAVGPVWRGGDAGEAALLAGAYRSAMRLAAAHRLTSVAFPAISTGIFGYPLAPATEIAVRTVRAALAAGTSVSNVVFACFSADVESAYRRRRRGGLRNSKFVEQRVSDALRHCFER